MLSLMMISFFGSTQMIYSSDESDSEEKGEKYTIDDFVTAAGKGDLNKLKEVVESEDIDDYNERSVAGFTALGIAALLEQTRMIAYLTANKDLKTNIDATSSEDNYTPLMYLANKAGEKDGFEKTIKYFIDNGANLILKNKDGKTAYDIYVDSLEGTYEDELNALELSEEEESILSLLNPTPSLPQQKKKIEAPKTTPQPVNISALSKELGTLQDDLSKLQGDLSKVK